MAEVKIKSEEQTATKCINVKLIYIKLHYFLLYGGLGAMLPYLPLNAQQLGLSATAVGIVYTILPFTYIFSKPIIGAITDRFHNMKIINMILITIAAILWGMILLIPQLQAVKPSGLIPMTCNENSSQMIPDIDYNTSCFSFLVSTNPICSFRTENCNRSYSESVAANCSQLCNNENNASLKSKMDVLQPWSTDLENASFVELSMNNSLPCDCLNVNMHLLSCSSSLHACLSPTEKRNMYTTIQFWGFAVFMFASGTALASAQSLTDAACYTMLGEKSELYGKQRLWGTVSAGSASLLSGYLNDVTSVGLDYINYYPGFYLMFVSLFLDVIVIFRMDIKQVHCTETVFKDVGRVFVSIESMVFAFGTFIVGALTPLVAQYETWFLKDLGASQLLLGLAMAVECLVAEVPFFFISGYLIKKFGHFNCMVSTFVGFFLRYISCYFLINPWLALPIDFLHGLTYGVFYATMTSYAYAKSPPGAEATMFGVLGGLYDGLGMAIGSLLSGLGFDYLGTHQTYLYAAIVSAVFVFLFIIANFAFRSPIKPISIEEETKNELLEKNGNCDIEPKQI